MSDSNNQTADNAPEAPEAAELAVTQLDQVTGGGANAQTTAQKAADKADALIRS